MSDAGVDPTTGLTYNQARWFDPTTGQFMIVDRKVESTWQPYSYANDNPISATDPTGLRGSGNCAPVLGAAHSTCVTAYDKSRGNLQACQSLACQILTYVVVGVASDGVGDLFFDGAEGGARLASAVRGLDAETRGDLVQLAGKVATKAGAPRAVEDVTDSVAEAMRTFENQPWSPSFKAAGLDLLEAYGAQIHLDFGDLYQSLMSQR